MILAEIDLNSAAWHFGTLLIAMFQPLLVLLLVLGFVVASAHLLTMIGTRWGDRRTQSKSLFFSIGLHALLGCGLIALLPEYRQRILMDDVGSEEEPIRLLTVPDRSALEKIESEGGNTPIWDQIKPSENPDWERFNALTPDLAMLDRALDKPSEALDLKPALAPDRSSLPTESLPVPEQEISADQGELREATVEMNANSLETQTRNDSQKFSAMQDRTPRPLVELETQADLNRPVKGSVDRIAVDPSPDTQVSSLTTTVAPAAMLQQAPQAEEIRRREGPAPALPVPELLGQNQTGERGTSSQNSSGTPNIARMKPRTNLNERPSPAIGRYRPQVTPTSPTPVLPEVGSSVSSQDRLLPVPGERPQMVLPDENLIARIDTKSVPSAYLLRSEMLREKAILKYGGSDASENAVDLSLKWLAAVQEPLGFWDASQHGSGQIGVDKDGIDRKFAGRDADTGITALAVLAFLGKLNTLEKGIYAPHVKSALRWLVAQQKTIEWPNGDRTSGYLGGEATQFAGMYCHGMATFAIAEAYAVSRGTEDAEFLREPLERAILFILATQIDDGGWRYVKGQPDGDMSMFGWQLMALKSAEAAGIKIPFETKHKMAKFLDARRLGRYNGLAGYREDEPPTPAMTAEALFCRQMLGLDNDQSATDEAARFLLSNRPSRSTLNLYYWYYGTLAMHQRGGQDWDQWNIAMRDLVISEQRTLGPQAGSWDPRGVWGTYGGRIYSTAVATLSLEVYYRYLRLEPETKERGVNPNN